MGTGNQLIVYKAKLWSDRPQTAQTNFEFLLLAHASSRAYFAQYGSSNMVQLASFQGQFASFASN